MPANMITKLHSRATALVAVGALLLFVALPVFHILTTSSDHHPDHCPICQTLQHAGNLLPPEVGVLTAGDMVPVATALRTAASLPAGRPLAVHPTRAPPAA